jgi:translation elongation factor P/translation initiation factor 5A
MKEQVRQRIESLERELQGLKDELEPKIEVGSWWVGNGSGEKAKVIKIDKGCVSYTYNDDTYQYTYNTQDFLKNLTPCEAPEPKIEVGSWWLGNVSEHKAKVTKVDSRRVHYTYEDGAFGALQFHNFTNRFTPCEAPKPEIEVGSWWLGNVSEQKAQVTKVTEQWIHYTFKDGNECAAQPYNFLNYYTPCEAPETPKIEVDSWWKNNTSVDKVRVTCNDRDMIHTINDVENRVSYSPTLFRKLFTPCEAPALKIEVGSWWLGNLSELKAKVTKINSERVYFTYEGGCQSDLQPSEFPNYYTPCEAPAKETWYLCTKDLGVNKFKRGEEYKMVCENPLTLIDEKDYPNRILGWGVYFVSPQER